MGRLGFGYQIQTIASLSPTLRALFGLDYAAIGTLIGLYLAAGIAIALPIGLIARATGDRAVVACGLVLMAAGCVVSALAAGPVGIGAGRVIAGVGAVTIVVLQGKIVADWFPGRRFMPAVSISLSAYPVGVGLAQWTQVPLAHAFGWQAAFLAGTVPALLGAAGFLAGYRTPPDMPPRGRFAWPSPREILLVAVAGTIWTFYNAGYMGFLSYVPALLSGRGLGDGRIGLVMGLATLLNVPAMFAGGWIAARTGRIPMFIAGAAMMSLSIAGIAYGGPPEAWAVVFGFLGALHPSIIIAAGTLSARPENRAIALGFFYTTYYAGGSVVPAICGRAADAYGSPDGALYAAATLSLLCAPLFFAHRALERRLG
jgi:MFS family permease